jgi:hypothetical protein
MVLRDQENEMSIDGHVQNGVVVLDQPVTVPDGTPVRVEVLGPIRKTLAERFHDVIGAGVDLPDDLAQNHDHYLHGTPPE